MKLDPAIASLLDLEPSTTSVSSHGGGGMSSASTSKITTQLPDGSSKSFFLKTGRGDEAATMFRGEHASLNAISSVVPTLCPKSYGHGTFSSSPSTSFLVTDFLDLSSRSSKPSGESLAKKLAKLHSTPAPIPAGYSVPQYGFPETTCCGDTPQENTYTPSWADFYANQRLRCITHRAATRQGSDPGLHALVEQTCTTVIPHLLSPERLKPLAPVVVHGDLWSGNAGVGRLPTTPEAESVVFDSSACYAHSEYELGIMKMFGGFGGEFLREYHALKGKCEPVDEYEDRVALYELYHHLNHYALFGGGYRSGAVGIMKGLIGKYGRTKEES